MGASESTDVTASQEAAADAKSSLAPPPLPNKSPMGRPVYDGGKLTERQWTVPVAPSATEPPSAPAAVLEHVVVTPMLHVAAESDVQARRDARSLSVTQPLYSADLSVMIKALRPYNAQAQPASTVPLQPALSAACEPVPHPGPQRAKLILAVIAAGASLAICFHLLRYERSERAHVEAPSVHVVAVVPGLVQTVQIREGQLIQAGQLVAELRPAGYEAALSAAREGLGKARLVVMEQQARREPEQGAERAQAAATRTALSHAQPALRTAKRERDQLYTQLNQVKLQAREANDEETRTLELINLSALRKMAAAADAQYKRRKQTTSDLQAELDSIAESGNTADARAGSSISAAQAALDHASMQFDKAANTFTKVYAPQAGVVDVVTVQPNVSVAVGQPLFTLRNSDGLMVAADFRASRLGLLQPGQAVGVDVRGVQEPLSGVVEQIEEHERSSSSRETREWSFWELLESPETISARIRLVAPPEVLSTLRAGTPASCTVNLW